ncbi:uncharacterized protein LOC141652138 isoform X2 [Silene latifolia]|uniref:uncharacterized protein LOC141652138 isoform X2 n=1 Tax=Silene latifolia TaxID=37657 RepID=UPI003D775D33
MEAHVYNHNQQRLPKPKLCQPTAISQQPIHRPSCATAISQPPIPRPPRSVHNIQRQYWKYSSSSSKSPFSPLSYSIEDVRPKVGIKKFRPAAYSNLLQVGKRYYAESSYVIPLGEVVDCHVM